MGVLTHRWSAEEVAKARRVYLQQVEQGNKPSYAKIAAELGPHFTASMVKCKLRYSERDVSLPDIDYRRQVPSPESLADRDRRIGARFRDLTAMIMGDPPIGFSALDRRLKPT